MRKIEINGYEFELAKDTRNFYEVINSQNHFGRTLWDCYTRPSHMKELIYALWKNWFDSLEQPQPHMYAHRMGVYSYNTNVFTLSMLIQVDGKYYFLKITPSHNYATELTFEF